MQTAPPATTRDKSFCTEDNLKLYLKDRTSLSLSDQEQLKFFIDNYSDCWKLWNKVRWDAAMESEGVKELEEYLGDDFVPYYDSSWGLANEWLDRKPLTEEEIAEFYKNTKNYVYNLVIWHESGDRDDYSNDIKSFVKNYNISSVIDFGCGVGTDSLTFIKENVKVYPVDFNCPATSFFKWRLKKRKMKTEFLDIEKIKVLPKADMFWAIDVFEHIPDPMEIMKIVDFSTCKVFAHCSRFNDTAGGRHPFHINFESKLMSDYLTSKGFKNIKWDKGLSVWINLNLVNIST